MRYGAEMENHTMSLFDKFRKNAESGEAPLSASIDKTPSDAAVVSLSGTLPETAEELTEKLQALPFIKLVAKNERDNGIIQFMVEYLGEEYTVAFMTSEFELDEYYRIDQNFTENEAKALQTTKHALYSHMTFGENPLRSYHLQIKLLCGLIPDPAGIADISGERILSGRWAKLAANSQVPPAPTYLFCIQAVNGGKKGGVWLHSHGLNRCGSIELEVLNLTPENCQRYAIVINTLAINVITRESLPQEYEPQFAIRLPDGEQIVTTWVRWETALKNLPRGILGGKADRVEGHNENTGVLFVYPSPDDYEKRRLFPLTIFNEQLEENPMLMISTEETKRMSALARERVGYLRRLYERRGEFKKFAALVKIGLEVDEQYKDGDMKEHIWFEVKEFHDDGSFSAELTQEAYYVESLKPGDIRRFTTEDITDWMAFYDDGTVNPDSVYLLEE